MTEHPVPSLGRQGAYALALAALLAAGAWLLWPGLTGPFLFDDFANLQNLRELGDSFSRESLGRYLAAWQGNPGRPLAALSFLIEDHAWPSDPEAFKRNNLLWHLLVAVGVFALCRRLLRLGPAAGSPAFRFASSRATELGPAVARLGPAVARLRPQAVSRESPSPDTPAPRSPAAGSPAFRFASSQATLADWIALAVTALWLLHPMQLSATLLVVQRMTVLASGLMVAGLLLYLRAVCDDQRSDPTRVALALAALAGFGALAFLAKENGPLIFAYATALNLTVLAPALARLAPGSRRALWTGTAGMTALLALALLWQVRDPAAAYAGRDFTLGERLLSQPRILWDYLHDIVLPKLGGGGIYHDDYVLSQSLLEPWTTLPAVLAVLAALALAWRFRRRFPLAAFAVLWFAAGHLIESTVIPLEPVFEHRNYLAMLGPLLAIAAGLARAPGDLKWPLRAALVLWLALTAAIAHQVARTFGDQLAQAEIWVMERPRSVRAWQFLASTYVRHDDYPSARNVLLNAQESLPEAQELAFQYALLQCLYGQADGDTFEWLIGRASRANWARVVPEVVMALRERVGSAHCREALTPERFRRLVGALLNNPEYARRRDTVAHLHYELARLELDLDRPEAALAHFEASYAERPDPQVAINQAQVLIYLGRIDEALAALRRAESTPQPWFKRWLDPYGDQTERVRERARAVQAGLTGEL